MKVYGGKFRTQIHYLILDSYLMIYYIGAHTESQAAFGHSSLMTNSIAPIRTEAITTAPDLKPLCRVYSMAEGLGEEEGGKYLIYTAIIIEHACINANRGCLCNTHRCRGRT